MTEGIIILKNGDKVEKALYVNSDSYFSFLGIKLLEKFKDNSLKDYILNYTNRKYNEINEKKREYYNSSEEDRDKNFKSIIKLNDLLECRTYVLRGANKYKCKVLLEQFPYIPAFVYTYDIETEVLTAKGYDDEEIEINKSNVDEYIEKFNECN